MLKKIINKRIFLLSLILLMCSSVISVEGSSAVFSDAQKIDGNKITAGEWTKEGVLKTADNGSVVINEVHWAGSPVSADNQWIELFNTTDEDISLKNWVIENAGHPKKELNITATPTIKAGGYLLITKRKDNSDQNALAVPSDVQNGALFLDRENYEQLILKNSVGNVIDETPEKNSPWPEGVYEEEEKYYSMQRKYNTQEKGVEEKSWYTCEPDDLSEDGGELDLMKSYWKEDHRGHICGTPGQKNLPTEIVGRDNNGLPTPPRPVQPHGQMPATNATNSSTQSPSNIPKQTQNISNRGVIRGEGEEKTEDEDQINDNGDGLETTDEEDDDVNTSGSNDANEEDENEEDDEEDVDAEDDEDNAGDGESNDPDESKGESGDTENGNNNNDDNPSEEETDNDESKEDEDEDLDDDNKNSDHKEGNSDANNNDINETNKNNVSDIDTDNKDEKENSEDRTKDDGSKTDEETDSGEPDNESENEEVLNDNNKKEEGSSG